MLNVKFEKRELRKMALSPKELEVLTLVALGYSDKEISVQLKIAYGTVRNHVDKAVLKLNAQNRTHAVIIYKLIHKDWLEDFYETNYNTLDSREVLSYRI